VNAALFVPIVAPLSGAAVCLLLRTRAKWQFAVASVAVAALTASSIALLHVNWNSGPLAAQSAGWPAPFGISLISDLLTALMLTVTAIVAVAVLLYSRNGLDARRKYAGFYPLFLVLLAGVCGAFLTGDLFNLYVWFEVMLISSFVLLTLGGDRAQLQGALKYVTLNLLSSALFLAAAGLLYGAAGTLNLADLAMKARDPAIMAEMSPVAVLLLGAFSIKAAVFPLFFWLPASYHTPPVPISALFAGLLTKVGVYSMIRVFSLVFAHDTGFTHAIILGASGLTMLTGVLGAVHQTEIRRILSFHIVSQIGYMIMGLGIFTVAALAGSVFYVVHHILVKTNLFLVAGLIRRAGGSFQLEELGGLYQRRLALAALFLIPALSLAGVPPLSGFFAKLALVQAGLDAGQYAIVAVSLIAGLLTLLSMMKIWNEAFWKEAPATPQVERSGPALWGPSVLLGACTVGIGLAAGPVMAVSLRAAEELINPSAYIGAVLGAKAWAAGL
jgi:multicomponent Na+:H+ antiporter subunit D